MKNTDIENITYLDIAYNILKKNKEGNSTKKLLEEVCFELNINKEVCLELLGEFYTDLNLDKRFIIVDNKWQLKEHNNNKKEELEDLEEDLEEEILDDEEEQKDYFQEEYLIDDENIDDDLGDNLEGLSIITDEDEEEY